MNEYYLYKVKCGIRFSSSLYGIKAKYKKLKTLQEHTEIDFTIICIKGKKGLFSQWADQYIIQPQ